MDHYAFRKRLTELVDPAAGLSPALRRLDQHIGGFCEPALSICAASGPYLVPSWYAFGIVQGGRSRVPFTLAELVAHAIGTGQLTSVAACPTWRPWDVLGSASASHGLRPCSCAFNICIMGKNNRPFIARSTKTIAKDVQDQSILHICCKAYLFASSRRSMSAARKPWAKTHGAKENAWVVLSDVSFVMHQGTPCAVRSAHEGAPG